MVSVFLGPRTSHFGMPPYETLSFFMRERYLPESVYEVVDEELYELARSGASVLKSKILGRKAFQAVREHFVTKDCFKSRMHCFRSAIPDLLYTAGY